VRGRGGDGDGGCGDGVGTGTAAAGTDGDGDESQPLYAGLYNRHVTDSAASRVPGKKTTIYSQTE
jgi:hypothetical protein